jgi:hypothetical protein
MDPNLLFSFPLLIRIPRIGPDGGDLGQQRRRIILLEGNAKCRHLKQLTCKGTLRQVFIWLRPRTPYPRPLAHCKRVYSMLIHTGEGVELNPREGERGNRGEYRSQNWVENTNMTDCTQEICYLQSINSDKHLLRSPFLVQFF